MSFCKISHWPRAAGKLPTKLLTVVVAALLAGPALAGNWLWDQDGNGIDDRIEAVNAQGLSAAFENDDVLEGRKRFAVREADGLLRFPVYVGYEQPPTDADIQRLFDAGVNTSVLHPYEIIDYIRMELSFADIRTVAALPGVSRIESVPLLYPMNNNATDASGVTESGYQRFPSVHEHLGITGRDVVVSILDTGVNDAPDPVTGFPGHESVKGKFVAGGNFDLGQPELNTPPDESENPIDRGEEAASNHGTHVAGTAIGTGGPSGFFGGMAPDALLVDQKVLSDAGLGFGSADGVEWAVLNKDIYDIRVLNLSLGGLDNSDGTDAGSQAINAAFDAGVVSAIAMGNDGETGWVSSPASADKAISVGAIADRNTVTRTDDVIAEFSNEGPRMDDGTGRVEPRMKPVVSAPGAGIISADGSLLTDGRQYKSLSGTSMATPGVAGIIALMLEANPDLTPTQIVETLKHTAEHRDDWGKVPADADPFPNADPNYHPSGGWGYTDAYAAVKEALRLAGDPASQVQVVRIGGIADANGEKAIHFGWISQREIGLDGYNVYRAPDINGSPGAFEPVNASPIAGKGQAQIEGLNNRNEYVFTDDSSELSFGQTYWYAVEHVSTAGTFREPAFPVTLGEPVPVARLNYTITHNDIDNDLLVLLGTGTQVARADWITTGKSAAQAESVTTVDGDPTIGNARHEHSLTLTSLDDVDHLLPPNEHQRWFLSVSEGGYVNRSGRVESFEIEMLDEAGNVTALYATGDPTPQQTVEGNTVELWITDHPEVVLPGEAPAVVEVEPALALQGSEAVDVRIFGGDFLPLAEVAVSGEGVEVVQAETVSGSEIAATFRIAADAPAGPRDITVTNPEGQADTGENLFTVTSDGDDEDPDEPAVADFDDAHPAIEYAGGWHRRDSGQASGDGYHRRMGANNGRGNGGEPTARLVFSGDQLTYFYATSENGGQADLFIDGALAATVDYSGSGDRNAPDFGHSITFDELGDGEHEVRVVHRAGAVYIDGFRVASNGSGDEAGANEAAPRTRSLTRTSILNAPDGLVGLATSMEMELELADSDEGVSIEIVDSAKDLSVQLLDPLGSVIATADSLLGVGGDSDNVYVLDAPVDQGGTYVLSVSRLGGLAGASPISVARTVPAR